MIVLLSISNCVVMGPVGSSAGSVNGNGDTSQAQTGDVGGFEEGML